MHVSSSAVCRRKKQQRADGGREAIAIFEPAKYLTTLVLLAGRGCAFSRASFSYPAFLSVRSIPPCEPAADFAPMTHGSDQKRHDVWQVGALQFLLFFLSSFLLPACSDRECNGSWDSNIGVAACSGCVFWGVTIETWPWETKRIVRLTYVRGRNCSVR